MQTVQEIYQNVILPLPENEQLKLASLILEKVTVKNDALKANRTGGDITNSPYAAAKKRQNMVFSIKQKQSNKKMSFASYYILGLTKTRLQIKKQTA
ncbi:MAG: hypothetical protein ABI954_10505 [Pyrinomonadaceae bacterium]